MNREDMELWTGREIRRRREGLDLTQQKLADRLGCKREQISMWETGDRFPEIHSLWRISLALGCEPSDLLLWADHAS